MISGVSNIIVPVHDQERAKTFWTETIGFEVVVDAPYREERWIEVRSPDGVRLVLSAREEWSRNDRAVPDEVPTSDVMFHCDDVEATYDELSSRRPVPAAAHPHALRLVVHVQRHGGQPIRLGADGDR